MAATNLIGLDIGSMSIRAVETARGKEGPVLANFGEVPLPEGAVQAGVIHDEKVVVAAPLSYAGSAARIWKLPGVSGCCPMVFVPPRPPSMSSIGIAVTRVPTGSSSEHSAPCATTSPTNSWPSTMSRSGS